MAFCGTRAVEANIGADLGRSNLKIVYPRGFQGWRCPALPP
jgi:hypothetical protein